MTHAKLAGVALACLLAGCGSASSAAGGPQTQGSPERQNRSVITQAQLAATNSETLYDAISKLHPDWLSARGPTSVSDATPTGVSIFMNGVLLGKAETLRDIRVLDVSEIRYWDAGQAAARFGMGHPRGVIEITRK